MNLYKKVVELLEKAMDTGEYFNPHFTDGVIELVEDYSASEESLISEKLSKWSTNMWSR